MKLDETHIAIPYDPEQQIAEFGWLWTDGAHEPEWLLIFTFEDDDGTLMVEAMTPDDKYDDGTRACYEAKHYAGSPYIPCTAPSCGPDAGAMVRVWLPGGGVITVTHEDRDEKAKALTDAVLAVLSGEDA
jgi:hypothetical protein